MKRVRAAPGDYLDVTPSRTSESRVIKRNLDLEFLNCLWRRYRYICYGVARDKIRINAVDLVIVLRPARAVD